LTTAPNHRQPPAPTPRPHRPLKVFLVDDHQLFRAGVRAEIGGAGAVEIVGEAGDVASAVRLVLATGPDVVLVDVHMPEGGGPEVVRQVLAANQTVRFLALSVSDAPSTWWPPAMRFSHLAWPALSSTRSLPYPTRPRSISTPSSTS
jgi:CheY-like chemotaxis protein